MCWRTIPEGPLPDPRHPHPERPEPHDTGPGRGLAPRPQCPPRYGQSGPGFEAATRRPPPRITRAIMPDPTDPLKGASWCSMNPAGKPGTSSMVQAIARKPCRVIRSGGCPSPGTPRTGWTRSSADCGADSARSERRSGHARGGTRELVVRLPIRTSARPATARPNAYSAHVSRSLMDSRW